MAVKKFKPMTPGTRHKVIGTFDDITSSTPEKSLLTPLKSTGGRNNSGKMTVRYIGGGHKKMYRIVDFKRNKDNMSGTVKTIEYDPNRSARIALITYADGEKRYILAPNGLQVGHAGQSGQIGILQIVAQHLTRNVVLRSLVGTNGRFGRLVAGGSQNNCCQTEQSRFEQFGDTGLIFFHND